MTSQFSILSKEPIDEMFCNSSPACDKLILWVTLTDFPRMPGRMRRRLVASTRKTRIMVSKLPLKMKEVLCRA